VARLADYDAERGTQLLRTLDVLLAHRGSITATAEALFVHQNTLRQRLRRMADITGLDLRHDDPLLLELAVKLVRLERARVRP
jgi:purine catabolism regulator